MNRRDFISCSVALLGGVLTREAFGDEAPRKTPRPNILMITCHDIGQHLGCYGVETVQTDNLDKLAAKGIRFSNFFSTSAVCSPGRGSLHTEDTPSPTA